ncbi:MAG TPA: chemotaxis protein CheA, partial [Lachnospiraceae bacterium]|uniref:Hpt domain-containing protein n=1 Tax=Anaerosporobacter sp. TaxID=1872529 RepID=UPI000EE39B09
MDVSQYLEIFIDETKEHLQNLNEQLLILEKEPDNVNTINEIFRAAHSLKGMAGTMGYKRMQRLTHDMENVFSEIRNGKMSVGANLVDVLFQGLDALESYLSNILDTADEGTEDNEPIITQLNKILQEGIGEKTEGQGTSATATQAETVEEKEECAKYQDLRIADYESHAMLKAKDIGQNVFGITIYIQETCILKAARAFLVFKALEEFGEVIKSYPEVQDIEDEKFEFDFSVILITKSSLEEVKAKILNVSEIKSVYIDVMQAPEEKNEEIEEVETTDNKVDTVQAASATATAPVEKKDTNQSKAQTNAKQQAKPVVNRSVRVDIEKLDVLMNLVSELIIAKNGLVSISSGDNENRSENAFNEQIEYLERVTTNLHESVMKVRMVPIESVVNRFPRMIRDLSKKLDKKMELYMTGEDTELDRTVIDEIGDPLMHLLRNSADHGL